MTAYHDTGQGLEQITIIADTPIWAGGPTRYQALRCIVWDDSTGARHIGLDGWPDQPRRFFTPDELSLFTDH